MLNKRDRLVAVSYLQPLLNILRVVFLLKPKEKTMPTKRPENDATLATMIDAMYEFIKHNPKYIMPIHDIYALYDIATIQFGGNMENAIKELKKQKKMSKK